MVTTLKVTVIERIDKIQTVFTKMRKTRQLVEKRRQTALYIKVSVKLKFVKLSSIQPFVAENRVLRHAPDCAELLLLQLIPMDEVERVLCVQVGAQLLKSLEHQLFAGPAGATASPRVVRVIEHAQLGVHGLLHCLGMRITRSVERSPLLLQDCVLLHLQSVLSFLLPFGLLFHH